MVLRLFPLILFTLVANSTSVDAKSSPKLPPAKATSRIKSRPPTPMAGLRVVSVHSQVGTLHQRAVILTEETSRSLFVEVISRGQTEGDPFKLLYQAYVDLPGMEARRFEALSWQGRKLRFKTGSLGQMTHKCLVTLPQPKRKRKGGSFAAATKQATVKPICTVARPPAARVKAH